MWTLTHTPSTCQTDFEANENTTMKILTTSAIFTHVSLLHNRELSRSLNYLSDLLFVCSYVCCDIKLTPPVRRNHSKEWIEVIEGVAHFIFQLVKKIRPNALRP